VWSDPAPIQADKANPNTRLEGARANRILVTPQGPRDGGDFGPHTPGTRTSGLQEAFDEAKRSAKDIYIAGGSWTANQTQPVVYVLTETLKIPWMQNFRMDSGHCVIHYAGKSGDAVVIDSQMSCSYRFGIIVSESGGAVVRLSPQTTGPDRFSVITTTDFQFNALVGGGGAWPGGEAYNTELDPQHRWTGTGLWLDGSHGSIDSIRVDVTEVVGCNRGILLSGACTHCAIDATLVHMCNTHLELGTADEDRVRENRLTAHMESEGIAGSVGARIFAQQNLLTLSCGRMTESGDVVLEETARGNLIIGAHLPHGITNRAQQPTNRIVSASITGYSIESPDVPASGAAIVNRHPFAVQIRIQESGAVKRWHEVDAAGIEQSFDGSLSIGQSFLLSPGEALRMDYEKAPRWVWKALP